MRPQAIRIDCATRCRLALLQEVRASRARHRDQLDRDLKSAVRAYPGLHLPGLPEDAQRIHACSDQLQEILYRRLVNVVHAMLVRWCTNSLSLKADRMNDAACLIRRHIEGTVISTYVRSRFQHVAIVLHTRGLIRSSYESE